MQDQTSFKPIHCRLCGDYIEWDLSQDRSAIIDKVCPSCKENPPPPHKRRKYIRISKQTKPTRRDVRDSLRALYGAGVLLSVFYLATKVNPDNPEVAFQWLSSLPWIAGILNEAYRYIKDDNPNKSNSWFSIILCIALISISFTSPVMAGMWSFTFYVFGGLGLIGYSLFLLAIHLLNNMDKLARIFKKHSNIGIGIGVISLFFISIMIFGWVAVRSAIGSVLGTYLFIMVTLWVMCLGLKI